MDPATLIAGGAQVLGGIMGNKAQARENRYQREWDAYYYVDQRETQARQRAEDRSNYISDMEQQFVRMRDNAERGGFNPLTAMGAAPVPMASAPGMGGFTASTTVAPGGYDMMAAGIGTLADEISGNGAERRAREKLQTDLLKIQIDQLKAQVKARPSMPAGSNTFASRPTRSYGVRTSTTKPSTRPNPDWFTLGDEVDELPPSSAPVLTRGKLDGYEVYYPGQDGEPWGIDELLTFGVTAAPQLAYKVAKENFGTSHIAENLKTDTAFIKSVGNEIVGAVRRYVPSFGMPANNGKQGRTK